MSFARFIHMEQMNAPRRSFL